MRRFSVSPTAENRDSATRTHSLRRIDARRVAKFAAYNVLVWGGIAFLFAIQASSRIGWSQPFGSSLLITLLGFAPYALLTPIVARIASKFPFTPESRLPSTIAHISTALWFVLITGLLMGGVDWIAGRTNDTLVASMLLGVFQYIAIDAVIYGLIATFFLMLAYARQWQEHSVAAAVLHSELAEARLNALTSRLQPHFLFNTLNAIAALVREEPRRAERLLARLSDLLRQALRDAEQSEVTLENELSFVEKYAEVQETRFGPRLNVAFDIDPEVLSAKVPPLLLQPIVENAFRHGLAPRSGTGSIWVRAEEQEDRLHLSVTDDGIGLPPAGVQDGVGLRTTRARLRQLYGEDFQFALTAPANGSGGALCTIVLPLRRHGAPLA